MNPTNKPYNDTDFPCFINSLILTLRPIAAKAIISSLLLICLKYSDDTSGDIIFKENNAHVIKNPITYHGTFIFLFYILYILLLLFHG